MLASPGPPRLCSRPRSSFRATPRIQPSTMTETPLGKPLSASGRVAPPDDVHAAMSELIKTDFGEVISA